jgi:hypothetical protein
MRNGDISNELPRRVIVTTDVFLMTEVTLEKKFKLFRVPKVNKTMRRELLSTLYLYTVRQGVTLELVSFEMNEDELGALIDSLDRMGTNPFRYFSVYSSVEKLVKELPVRPEVIGVLDTPNRLLRYGHWGLDFANL